jgi:cytochrome c oxidase cbb3-type subunit 3
MAEDKHDYDGIHYRSETGAPAIFKVLLGVLVVWGIGYMGYYLFSGWSSEQEFAAKQQEKAAKVAIGEKMATTHPEGDPAAYIANGKKEYAARCAACHGENGKGGFAPDLTIEEYKYGRTPQAIKETIANGRPGGMPAFGNEVSHEQMEGLVQYLLSL